MAGTNGSIKLCDFGAAHDASAHGLCLKAFGRRDFLAPEILRGEDSNHWSDLYYFGAVLFEILMPERRFNLGHRQLELKSLKIRLEACPEAIYYIHLTYCLEHSPWRRPASAAQARFRLPKLSHGDLLRAQNELGLWVSEAPQRLIPPDHKYYGKFSCSRLFLIRRKFA